MPELMHPLWLAALPVPPLLWYLWHGRRRIRSGTLYHPLAGTLAGFRRGRHAAGWPSALLWGLGCLLMLAALARPQWPDAQALRDVPRHELVIAVDVSGSMRGLDLVHDGEPRSRIERVQTSLVHFLEASERLRVSLLVFGDRPLTFMPATTDRSVAAAMVSELHIGLAGERTNIGDTITLALQRAGDDGRTPRALILFTDGVNTAGDLDPVAAATLAREQGMRVHTLGFGRDDAVPFPLGNGEIVHREVPPDRDLLRTLAETTGGVYRHIETPTDIDAVLADIRGLERARSEIPAARHEGYPLLIACGVLCLVLAETGRRVGA